MDRPLQEHAFFRQLTAQPVVEAVWLFGSTARGTAGRASDVDLAIACPRASVADWAAIGDILAAADTLRRVEAIRWDELREDDPLRASILADRVLLFEREPGRCAQGWRGGCAPATDHAGGIAVSRRSADEAARMSDKDTDFPSAHARLGEALARLREGLEEPGALDHPLMRDGLIQRFEFTVDPFWKTLRFALRRRGLNPAGSPRAVLEAAFAEGWLDEEAAWLGMVQDRNRTSHAYRKVVADEVLARLPGHLARMRALAERLPALAP